MASMGGVSHLAFELILQPTLLETKVLAPNRGPGKHQLPRGVPDQVGQLLTDFLTQLNAADARAAAMTAAASASASASDVTVLTPPPGGEFNSRRRCCIQSMVLSIAASFR